MRAFAIVAIILLAASVAFADTATQQYTAGDWLSVTRTVNTPGTPLCLDSHGISDACAAGGAIQPNEGTTSATTQVTLTATNVGPVDRTGVGITEDLSYIPAGAAVTFNPQPTSSDGRSATWVIGTFGKGETFAFTYTIAARLPSASLSAIPDVAVAADSTVLSLSAPDTVTAGQRATATVTTSSGAPLPDTVVVVTYPDGIKHSMRSDQSGTISFTAQDQGTYTYSIDGYSLSTSPSTQAAPVAAQVPTAPVAAATSDNGLGASIMGIIPILAAIFAIAVIALILYNFFTSRREDEEYLPSNVPSTQSGNTTSGMNYAQNYSFGTGAKEEEKMRDRTRDIIESRKKSLATGAAAAEPEEDEEKPAGSMEDAQAHARSTEATTATDEDMASILSELEHKAREGGETTEDEEAEVERTISELEAIREKLRAMRTKGKGAAAEGAETEEEGEPEEGGEQEAAEKPEELTEPEAEEIEASDEEGIEPEEEKPAKKKQAPKKIVYEKRVQPKVKPVSKSKKMRFGNKGVKKR